MHSSLVSTVEVFIFPLTFLKTSPGLPEMTTTFKFVRLTVLMEVFEE
jgi:hypothetical protein